MRFFLTLLLVIATATAFAQNDAPAAGVNLTPAQRNMAEAQRLIAEKPAEYSAYNLLANALIQRACETADASFYAHADEELQESLKLSPNNFDTKQIQVSILLGKHEFPAALEAARTLNKQVPDAVMVYGLLTDANMALGNYKDAETSAQWMLDLRPGNLTALIRAAQLRELFGDVEGSEQLYEMALQSTPATETGERAWLLTQIAHLSLTAGKTEVAEQFLQQALAAFPNYPDAVGTLAEVRVAQKRYDEAVTLLQQRYSSAPRAQGLYQLAETLLLAKHKKEAKKSFAEFEAKALAESNAKDNANRDLVFFYADHAHEPGKALALARQEYSWRQDVFTLDAYAWALHVNGQDEEARKQIEAALAVGIRDGRIFRHAGEIALKTGDRTAAERYTKEASELNQSVSDWARNKSTVLSAAGY